MFSKETEYALRGLVYIQSQNIKGRRPGVVEIAQEIEGPQSFVAKILYRMVKGGFVESTKGKEGGFHFDKDKAEVPLKDLIIAIEGSKLFTSCGFGLKKCDCEYPCPFHFQYAPIRDALDQLVSTLTIQSMAKDDNLITKIPI
jgi:Rrf2 family iron-sulfur cluster assembly transcriptional regulator